MLHVSILPVLKDNYIFIIHSDEHKRAIVVDPAISEPVLDFLQSHDLTLDAIINTHHHHDHVGGNNVLHEKTQCRVIGHGKDTARIPSLTDSVYDGEEIELLGHLFQVMSIDGHTIGHIAYYLPNMGWLFSGDTVFGMGCGRLFEGSYKQMFDALKKIKSLPKQTKIYCTHEYTLANGKFALSVEPHDEAIVTRVAQVSQMRSCGQITIPLTLSEELQTNLFLRAKTLESFADLRQLKDRF